MNANPNFTETAKIMAEQLGIESRSLVEEPPGPEAADLLDHAAAVRFGVLPLARKGDRLWVAMDDPLNYNLIADLYDTTGFFIEPVLVREPEIRYFLNELYSSAQIKTIASQFLVEENIRKNQYQLDAALMEQLQSAPTVKLVDSLIESAVLYRASDIHIEPYEHILRARFRIDGQLANPQIISGSLLPNVISRLKIMGGMDIAEKRLPQDGHFSLSIHGESVDFRLSTLPALYGEKAMIRLLYSQSQQFGIDSLGFFPEDIAEISRLFRSPYGAVIITGPTGSGKTTTLTSFLSELNKTGVNIVTVEDPVENPVEGINHVAVDHKAGMDFPRALRHILRQDPDIIMLGEIRDAETAAIAIQAAITGHLVLSTLHTNDAAGVFPRLADMGIEPFMIAASLNGVIAQRLLRRLCPFCKAAEAPKDAEWLKLPADAVVYGPRGCNHCGNTGYKGRFAIYEYIIVDEDMRRDMAEEGLARKGRRSRPMLENAVKNVILGNTSAAEVMRVVFRD
jgi:type IV pilus assembly protein PilB